MENKIEEIDKIKEIKNNNELNTEENTEIHKKKYKALKIALAILSLAIIIITIIYMIPVMTQLSTPEGKIELKDKVQSTGFLGMMMLFGLQVAQIFLFILPGEPIEIIAGMCYGGFWGTIFILISAAIISTGIFFLVRKLGKKFVYEFCNEEKVKKIENSKMFQDPKKVEMIIFILFLLPGTPKDLLVYIAGLLPIKPSRFIIISTLARIPSIISSTYAGEKILDGNYKMAAIMYIIIVAICAILIFIFNKFDKNKTAQNAINTIK